MQGKALHPDSATLLIAIDKLLTVGSYYSSEHAQYSLAAEKACATITKVIGASSNHVTIEITAQGMMISQQVIDPNHRNVRLLHDLLVPLNIARLEISGSLTAADLRQAISALQNHKLALGQSSTFHELVFDNLPPSMVVVSCSVLQQTDETISDGALDDLLDNLGGNTAFQAGNQPEDETEKLARDFMEMVTAILENVEKFETEGGLIYQDDGPGSYVTRDDLINLKKALYRLVEVNPNPEDLAKLISQARRALDLSRDADSVNLVFEILKKDMAKKQPGAATPPIKSSRKIEFKQTVEELLGAVTKLESEDAPIVDPWDGSRSNQFGICLFLLRSDPPRALRRSIIEILEDLVARRDFATNNLLLCAQDFHLIAHEDEIESLDDLLSLMTGIMRKKHMEMLAPFWMQLTDLSDQEQILKLWPHLVNDILLGFHGAPTELISKLAIVAGNVSIKEANSQGRRLERQPALKEQSASRDLFNAPTAKLYPVLALLMSSPLKSWLGAEIFRALRAHPCSPLIEVVVAALGEHKPEHTSLYLSMIRNSTDPEQPEDIGEAAAEILYKAISLATPAGRQSNWVPRGLTELNKIAPKMAHPLLNHVLNDRKLLFFKAWPEPAREVAAGILTTGKGKVQ